MDNEIAEGLHLGTMLVVSVAIAIILVTISGIVRIGYVYRERDVLYNNEVQDRLIWKQLHLEADYQYGEANKRHVTDTDAAMKFVSDYSENYQWAVFIRNETNTVWQCFTNTEVTDAEKTKLLTLPNIATCQWHLVSSSAINSTSAMVDKIYSINSERAINNQEIKNYVRVFAYDNRKDILANRPPKSWFESDYVPSDLGFYVFIIY